MKGKLYDINKAAEIIKQGKLLMIAADEKLLRQLPKGNWIGGTIPYFFDEYGAKFTTDKVFVQELINPINTFKIVEYNKDNIKHIAEDGYDNGYIILILPYNSPVHFEYALNALKYNKLHQNPIVGWVSGYDLNNPNGKAKVINGLKGDLDEENAIVIHVKLPEEKIAVFKIVNIYEEDPNSPVIEFLEDGFSTKNCLIDGEPYLLADYIKENNIDINFPLITTSVRLHKNISFKEIKEDKTVEFYLPFFKDLQYRFTRKIEYKNIYRRLNLGVLKPNDKIEKTFGVNCILNYTVGKLEGKVIENFTGPATFGEVAYVLHNQTLVELVVIDNEK